MVHFGDTLLGSRAGGKGDKAKAAGVRGAPFHGEEDVGDSAGGAEYFAEAGLVGGCWG